MLRGLLMYSKILKIRKSIIDLESIGVEYSTAGNFTSRYTRYLERYNKAVELLGANNDVSMLKPIENPSNMIYKAYWEAGNSLEREELLKAFDRKEIQSNIMFDFYNLDTEDRFWD